MGITDVKPMHVVTIVMSRKSHVKNIALQKEVIVTNVSKII